jgi:hypothetical protein
MGAAMARVREATIESLADRGFDEGEVAQAIAAWEADLPDWRAAMLAKFSRLLEEPDAGSFELQ